MERWRVYSLVFSGLFFFFSFWDDVATCCTLQSPLQVGNELLVEFKYLRISSCLRKGRRGGDRCSCCTDMECTSLLWWRRPVSLHSYPHLWPQGVDRNSKNQIKDTSFGFFLLVLLHMTRVMTRVIKHDDGKHKNYRGRFSLSEALCLFAFEANRSSTTEAEHEDNCFLWKVWIMWYACKLSEIHCAPINKQPHLTHCITVFNGVFWLH